MNTTLPLNFYQCAYRLCDPERAINSYTITVKANSSRCFTLGEAAWVTCDDPYSNVEATLVDYTTANHVCRDVLIRVHTSLQESISIDILIGLRDTPANNAYPTKRTCPCLVSPAPPLTTPDPTGPPDTESTTDATSVQPTSPPATSTPSSALARNSTGSSFGATTTIVTIVMTGVLIGSLHVCF